MFVKVTFVIFFFRSSILSQFTLFYNSQIFSLRNNVLLVLNQVSVELAHYQLFLGKSFGHFVISYPGSVYTLSPFPFYLSFVLRSFIKALGI